ncbi:probable NADH dehydrogenase [ubiquinone] 1 beta subcomplex subunit 2, mitochondrial [Bacillus rossius redtenbacheri]|uniref:probable NADH dehydrogenase [ubiquinone] 1 beta subcomplex subunit 2, mitochondrial n=1 Tax=Bacillus rossius redtenbacheri TaxID=93214 RepID=UPI002FDCF28D
MLVSRVGLLSKCVRLLNRRNLNFNNQLKNNSHAWSYRTAAPPAPILNIRVANTLGTLMWWWVLWHLYHQYDHIIGEFDYPDISAWTDEELGIPPDDEE